MTQQKIESEVIRITCYLRNDAISLETSQEKLTAMVATTSKSDSVAFGEWLVKNKCTVNGQVGEMMYWNKPPSDHHYTTSELYQIFNTKKEG